MADSSSNSVQVRYFENLGRQITSRFGHFKAIESPSPLLHSNDSTAIYSNAAIISQNCASFKFDATFRNQKTGRYYIVWKILLQPGFLVSRGFHVQAIISYEDEPAESSGSLDVTIPETRIKELSVNEWHDITVREQLIIRPHRGAVNVQLYLSNNEDPNKGNKENKEHNEYHNFKVGSVEIHPYTNLGPDFISHGPTTGDPFASLNIKRADNIPISRISAATDVDHIAVLRVAKDKVHIDIWDYGGIQDQPKDANSLIDWEPKAEKALDNQSGIHGLSLGISLSPDGRQLVVFQEPRIGDWRDGEIIKYAKFEFKLFHVSIVMAPRSKKSEVFEIDMNSTGSELSRSDAASNIWSLRSFVGFAKFLPTRSAMATTAIGEYSTKSEGTNGAKSLFAACNGIYLDIFDCSKNPWLHLHSIALTDLSPTLSRRITCQMMVESMGSDTFLWLEAQGQACSTWSIENGANISHLSSEDNVNFADRMYQSTLKMAISPDESIVALAGIDGSIRTFFAKSGIEIKSAWPKNFKIEYIGFLGENDQILLIIRDSITNQLQSWILDPMDLRIRIKSNPVPIPTAGTTISVVRHIGASELANKSIVCAAEGTALRFYRIQEPPTVPTATPPKDFANQELADIDATIDYDDIEEGEVGFGEGGKLKYKLRCKIEKEPLENGEGKFYWVLRVSVRQETDALEPEEKILFNFVPEPWLRCLTSEYTMPDQLLTTYFLPCRKRFIIIGLQSIQIWGLPSKNNPNLKLLAIWSMPKNDIISPSKGLKPSSKVFDHFWNIEHALINDNYSDLTRLKVKLFGSNKYEDIVLPGDNSNTDQYGVVPCCLSIHLLAAAYSFATENENSEQHARALVMFSIQNINRVTTLDSILTVMSSIGNVPGIKKPDGQMLVNVLILLLSNSSFRRTSNPFIREMLSTTQWIPREQLSLNPIQQAINSENRDIVHTLVDYCIQNAKRHHPAYLTPAIQSLNDLKEHYRELAARMFSEASYIKVKNKSYVAANATIANPHYKFWKPRSKSLEDYTNPVLYLRSQLPFRSNARSTLTKILSGCPSIQSDRIIYFPGMRQEHPAKPCHEESDKRLEQNSEFIPDIYVTPFPRLSAYSNKGRAASSGFTSIAGTRLLDNPAMVATLRFKWYKYAKARWAARFSVVLIFSLLFLIITAMQIYENSNSSDASDNPRDKYLTNWVPALYIIIILGCVCIMFEIWQFILDWKNYFLSPYNYLDLISFIFPVVGCGEFLYASQAVLDQAGPSQIWWISFALLAVYINIMFELKVFRPLGTAVHIILNITRRILWFLAVLAMALVAFTHAFMHITHTKRDPCINKTGDDLTTCEAVKSRYPSDPRDAIFSTFFFIAGIYDPLNNDLDPASKSGYSFKILLALFILFTVILLMNVLIAIMNDGYSESRDEGQLAWLKQWSLVIVETELSMMGNTTRGNRDLFPDYIYYGASQQEVEEHAKRTSQTQNLEAPNIKGLQPNVATHKAMQRNFTSVREELETLMNNQEQIQSEVTQMNDFVWRLIELLAQQNSDPQYNMLALHLGQEYSQMEPNLNPPGPTTSSFTTVSATSSSIRAKHTTRTHSNNELAPGSSLRPRMRMAEQQKRHRGSLHSRRTSGSTHGVAANPEPPQASPAQQVQPPPTFPPSESSNTSTTTATICEEVAVEVIKSEIVIKEDGHVKEVVEVKETGKVSEPAVSKGSSWFRRVISTTEAAARGAAGAVGSSAAGATGAVVHGAESATHGVGHVAGAVAIGTGVVAVGAGLATAGALYKVDGVWKRTVQVLATRKAHVDEVCPIAKTSYVYYDEDVYDAVLTEKNTGVTYVIQLVYDTETKVYYVYCRYGETDYKLDGPHETIEAAKDAFQLIYKEKFDVDWTERETSVSERWSYEVKTYETFEEVEEVEEVVEETEVNTIIVREHCICLDEATVTTETTTTTTEEVVNQEEESVIVDATIEEVVQDVAITEESVDESEPVQEITTIATETGAVPGSSSQHSPDEPQYQGRPQKSNIFTYNIKRQSTDEVDYVSGGKHQQHRDDYESDDGGAYKQNKTRRRPAAKAKAKYLDDN